MVVVRFRESDQCRRPYGVYTLLGISSDGSVSPVMDPVLSVRSPNSSHFVGRRLTKSRIGIFQCPDHTGDICKVSFAVTLGRVKSPGLKIFRSQLIGIDFSTRSDSRP